MLSSKTILKNYFVFRELIKRSANLKIVVLLKQTPDTEAKISFTNESKSIDKSSIKYIVNPYDEFAIEQALQMKESSPGGGGEVVVVSFGTDDIKEKILKALAMGADRGVQISQDGLEDLDSLGTAKVLVSAINKEKPDLVLCGRQGIDEDNMHVGVMVAELLEWPHVNVVTKMTANGESITAQREVEGGMVESYEVQLPAVFGAHKSLNNPRYASLPGIMKAKRKPYERHTVADLGLDANELKKNIKTTVTSYSYPPEKPSGKVFKGESTQAMVDKVVNALREEAKVI